MPVLTAPDPSTSATNVQFEISPIYDLFISLGTMTHPAERDESKQISLQRIGKAADPIVDSEAREPWHVSRARPDPVQREIARDHAAVDAQRDQPHRHDVVHNDIGAQDDGDVFMREWQNQQRKELRKPRKVVVGKMQQG